MKKSREKQTRSTQPGTVDATEAVIDPVTYEPTGNIEKDLPILCLREHAREATCEPFPTPPGGPRAQPPPESAPASLPANAGKSGKAAREKQAAAAAAAAAAALQAQAEEPPPDPNAPKTYKAVELEKVIQRVFQVRYANEEDKTSVEELRTSKWRLTNPYVTVLLSMMPFWKQLTTLEIVNATLDHHRFSRIMTVIQELPLLRDLSLDGNFMVLLEQRNLFKLLQPPFNIRKLSLRCMRIEDKLCQALQPVLLANTTLTILDLSLNCIEDDGAIALANVLRFNRTLLMLSLIGNNISDVGAGALAQALMLFELTHEEIVRRRRLMSERRKNSGPTPVPENPKSRIGERRAKSPTAGGKGESGKGATLKGGKKNAGQEPAKGLVKGVKDDKGKKGDSRAMKSRAKSNLSQTSMDIKDTKEETETRCALIDEVEAADGKQFCSGNLSLASLSLTENPRMSGLSAVKFLDALKYQAHACHDRTAPRQGLLRLAVTPEHVLPELPEEDSRPPSSYRSGTQVNITAGQERRSSASVAAAQHLSEVPVSSTTSMQSVATPDLNEPWLTIHTMMKDVDPIRAKRHREQERERERKRALAREQADSG